MQYARYRGAGYYTRHFPPGVKWLLISNSALFVVYFFAVHSGAASLFQYLSLWPRAVLHLPAVWQLFTYMFLHDPFGFFHILFNMLTLWMFGVDLERDWGTRRFLQYYFLCGVGAGVCVVVANVLFGSLDTRTIGASGAIYGLLLAFGVLYPDRMVLFSFLFPIKAKYFVMILGAIAFMSSFAASGSGVSHVAHLGGMVFGYAYLRWRFLRTGFSGLLGRKLIEWRQARARRRFQVYMRDRDSHRDRRIH
ncbi:MAG: rhomboid family intramembrane serine protease [Bryobacteraceae bacterium]